MHDLEVSQKADKIFKKLSKKDSVQLKVIKRRIDEILENPEHYKPLKGDMHGARRVHIDKSFVLVYEIERNTVRILDYDHHDKIY